MDPKIRILESQLYQDGKHWIKAAGPSSVSKPLVGVVTGSFFIESDTGKVYVYDETSTTWTEM